MSQKPTSFQIAGKTVTGNDAILHFQNWCLSVEREGCWHVPRTAISANAVFQNGMYGDDIRARNLVLRSGVQPLYTHTVRMEPVPAFPGWRFKGRTYKTVNGLLNALTKDSGAREVSMVDSNHQIKAYGADRRTVIATYNVARPKAGQVTEVTRA